MKKDDTRELLDFMIMVASWPYSVYMSGPDPETGKTGRETGKEWLLSISDLRSISMDRECVYAPTSIEAIRRAKLVFEAKARARRIVERARRCA